MPRSQKPAYDVCSHHAGATGEAQVGTNTLLDRFSVGDLTALHLDDFAANDNGRFARNEEVVLDERIISSLLVVLALLAWCLPILVN